jgi:hypothetical protein
MKIAFLISVVVSLVWLLVSVVTYDQTAPIGTLVSLFFLVCFNILAIRIFVVLWLWRFEVRYTAENWYSARDAHYGRQPDEQSQWCCYVSPEIPTCLEGVGHDQKKSYLLRFLSSAGCSSPIWLMMVVCAICTLLSLLQVPLKTREKSGWSHQCLLVIDGLLFDGH